MKKKCQELASEEWDLIDSTIRTNFVLNRPAYSFVYKTLQLYTHRERKRGMYQIINGKDQ